MSRRKSRRAVLQILYRNEFHDNFFKKGKKENIDFFLRHLNEKDREFSLGILADIQKYGKEIHEIIKKYTQNWKPERISLVDLNIMKLAVFEILFCSEVPDKAALNEALELARQFGEKNSVSFVNGILDQILKNEKKMNQD